jgi:hypothetical protein
MFAKPFDQMIVLLIVCPYQQVLINGRFPETEETAWKQIA